MELLKYDIGEEVIAFSTKRGSAESPYSGFNITHYCGDSEQHVTECRKELCRFLQIADNNLILPRQTHSCNIVNIDSDFMNKNPESQQDILQGVDALITSLPQTCIGISTADCVPILLFDKEKRVAAAIHAGWRGTVERITEACIDKIVDIYNSNTNNIKAIIAPSIGPEAFEVGDEVYDAFSMQGFPMKEIATRKEKWHIDLWKANKLQLLARGVPEKSIEITGICTHTHHSDFFSARRLGINSGRIFNGIMIK